MEDWANAGLCFHIATGTSLQTKKRFRFTYPLSPCATPASSSSGFVTNSWKGRLRLDIQTCNDFSSFSFALSSCHACIFVSFSAYSSSAITITSPTSFRAWELQRRLLSRFYLKSESTLPSILFMLWHKAWGFDGFEGFKGFLLDWLMEWMAWTDGLRIQFSLRSINVIKNMWDIMFGTLRLSQFRPHVSQPIFNQNISV